MPGKNSSMQDRGDANLKLQDAFGGLGILTKLQKVIIERELE